MRGFAINLPDQFRVFLCGDLDLDPTGFGEEDERLLARPVNRDREIVFVLDIELLLGKDLLYGQALDLFSEELLCHLAIAVCLVRPSGYRRPFPCRRHPPVP